MMSHADASFNLDSLLEDLQNLNTADPRPSSKPLFADSSFPSHASNSAVRDAGSPSYLPHPPSINKSPTMLNPKIKFAVLPDCSSNYHQNQQQSNVNNAKQKAKDKDEIDNILDMLNSPSMQTSASVPVLSPYKPTSNSLTFSPEIAKKGSEMFSAFGLAVELTFNETANDSADANSADENHSNNVSPRKGNDLASSSWDENSNEPTPPTTSHGHVRSSPSRADINASKSLHSKSKSFNDSFYPANSSGYSGEKSINSLSFYDPASSSTFHNNNAVNSHCASHNFASAIDTNGPKHSFPSSSGSYINSVPAGMESKSHSDNTSNFFPPSIPSNNKDKTRCTRVVVAGTSLPRGLKASAFSKLACDALLCVHCNFKVLTFADSVWDSSIDYMFVRNNMPNKDKLSSKVVAQGGSVAYCCQCNWLAEGKERALVQGVSADPQWICTGHW